MKFQSFHQFTDKFDLQKLFWRSFCQQAIAKKDILPKTEIFWNHSYPFETFYT